MWDIEPRKILVAVDLPDPEAALQYAVGAASRRGCGIHLVHVARPALGSRALDDVALIEGELRETSQLLLSRASVRAQRLIDELAPEDDRLSVSTELSHGPVVTTLHSLSRHAAQLVLQHEGMGLDADAPALSVTVALSAVAACPVVAVPQGWRPASPGEGTGVVVGVEDVQRDAAAVAAARQEAQERMASLHVVCAADSQLPSRVLAHAADADLVVVARHHHKHVVGAPLAASSAELLRDCAVPVMVVDPVAGVDEPAPTPDTFSTAEG